MKFRNRTHAGKLLAGKCKSLRGKDVVVYGLPRGGVVPAVEIARYLNAPLDLLITRKISHPYNPEYAIAAISEDGQIVGNLRELLEVDDDWFEAAVETQRLEAIRRRKKYLHGRSAVSPTGKIAILVDDGAATGLTLRAGILALRRYHPIKIIVAVPVVPKSTAAILQSEADTVIALTVPTDSEFMGAVGAYYDEFSQVSDEEVIALIESYKKTQKQNSTVDEYGKMYAKDFLM